MRQRCLVMAIVGGLTAGAQVPMTAMAAENGAATLSGALSQSWDSRRNAWQEQGATLGFGYKADLLHNSGGLRSATQTMWQVDARLGLDLERLAGLAGTSAYVQVLEDRGGHINEHDTGSLMGVSNIEVPTASAHVFHAWLQKTAFDGRLAVLLGLYPIDSEFATIDSAGVLVNPTFGASSDFSPTRGPSIFPVSAFGSRIRWTWADRAAYVQGALLDGIPGDPHTYQGTHIEFNKGDGSFGILELGYKPGEAADDDKARALVAPFDKLAIGAWRYTAHADDLIDRDAAGNPLKRTSYGYYLLSEKTLYREAPDAPQGLAGFLRYSATDGDSTPIRHALNFGLRYQGLIAGRGDDIAAFGFSRSRLSEKLRSAASSAGLALVAHEDVLEITYRAQMFKWLALQPIVQRFHDPSLHMRPGHNRVSVVGLRVDVEL